MVGKTSTSDADADRALLKVKIVGSPNASGFIARECPVLRTWSNNILS